MAEDDVGGAAVVVAGEEFGGGVVGEMADAGEDALLDRPGVGAVAEHLEVVVGFEQEDVDALEGGLDVGRHVAEVGGDGHADGFGWDSKTKPQGSAASWGMVKGVMEMSPMEKLVPEWKYSTAGR